MKTFRITIKTTMYYNKEIRAKNYEDAVKKADTELWHGNFVDWGSDHMESDVDYVEEIV